MADHARDEHCSINGDTDCCTVCGVDHSQPCRDCGGGGFHSCDCAKLIVPDQPKANSGPRILTRGAPLIGL